MVHMHLPIVMSNRSFTFFMCLWDSTVAGLGFDETGRNRERAA